MWKPMKMRWLGGRLESGTPRARLETMLKLLAMGEDGKAVIEKHLIGRSMEWVKEKLGTQDFVDLNCSSNPNWGWDGNWRWDDDASDGYEILHTDAAEADEKGYVYYETWAYGKIRIYFEKRKVKEVRLWKGPPPPPPPPKWK
ncbi:MAG: hypothetical protein E3J72_11020 [Planctomycetota bacterium]|nr:MAG: hypothetical protein E3J72_11020 [Planctomycetota bacterium]